MKLKKIELKNFYQFKDFTLDLTYPQGHPKEGQPLDKVCFIGQSGTGKTTLLKLIQLGFHCKFDYNFIAHTDKFNPTLYLESFNIQLPKGAYIRLSFTDNYRISYDFVIENNQVAIIDNIIVDSIQMTVKQALEHFRGIRTKLDISVLSYPAEKQNDIPSGGIFMESIFYFFNIQDARRALDIALIQVQQYRIKETNFRIEISKKIMKENSDELKNEYQNWLKENPNPVSDLAQNCLDPILNKFHLKTKTELEDVNDLNLQIQNVHTNEIIPFDSLSTGTKQIIISAIPLYYLKPNNCGIFFDEPERSLYPDIQAEIIEIYTSLAKNSQFFFATHSAFILSCFEPWEIAELKFNQDGYILRDKYYRGENHVDNYFIDPRYMRWDTIYQKVYDFLPDGNSKERTPKLVELAQLEEKLKKLKIEKADKDLIDKTWNDYKKLAEKIGWDTGKINYDVW